MTDGFTEQAASLSGLAARMLAWPPPLFWEATPAELALALQPADATHSPITRQHIETLLERDRNG